jgi:hypothetical protein
VGQSPGGNPNEIHKFLLRSLFASESGVTSQRDGEKKVRSSHEPKCFSNEISVEIRIENRSNLIYSSATLAIFSFPPISIGTTFSVLLRLLPPLRIFHREREGKPLREFPEGGSIGENFFLFPPIHVHRLLKLFQVFFMT